MTLETAWVVINCCIFGLGIWRRNLRLEKNLQEGCGRRRACELQWSSKYLWRASWQIGLQPYVNRRPARTHEWQLEGMGHALKAAAEMHQRAPFLAIVVSQCNYGVQTWMHRSNISVVSPPGAEWTEHLLNNAFVLLVHIILWENAIRNISISLCLFREIAFFSRTELKHHRCAIRKLKTL